MLVLGIDTATATASVALVRDGQVLAETTSTDARSHAALLPGLIQQALAHAGATITDLARIGVSVGPGSFTGLRVGLGTAKGLAMALGIPLVTVPTLEVLAASVPDPTGWIIPVLDARKGEVYAAELFFEQGRGEVRSAPRAVPVDSFQSEYRTPGIFVGEGMDVYGERLTAGLPAGSRVLQGIRPLGAVVAAQATVGTNSTNRSELALIAPLYVAEPEVRSSVTR